MGQINFRIPPNIEALLDFIMKKQKLSKAALTKEIFLKGLQNYIMPYLAQLYKEGKTTVKQIAYLTDLPFIDVITQLSTLIEDIQGDLHTEYVSEETSKELLPLLQQAQKEGLSFTGTIHQEISDVEIER